MKEQEYFTKDEIIDTLKNAEDYSVDSFSDLFTSMFNTDYYITGKQEASEALATYKNDEALDGYNTALEGALGAVVLVERYELDQFASIHTPLYNPEALANMVEFIRGEALFTEALSKANLYSFEETTAENLKKFIKAVKEL